MATEHSHAWPLTEGHSCSAQSRKRIQWNLAQEKLPQPWLNGVYYLPIEKPQAKGLGGAGRGPRGYSEKPALRAGL